MIRARLGQDIYDFAAELVVMAWHTNAPVEGKHNDLILEAWPGMTREQVLKPWDDAVRRSYLKR